MSNSAYILASAAILLTFIGGLFGNILTVYAIRFKEKKTKNINWLQKIAIVLYIAILAIIIGFFLYYLILNLFINSYDLLLLCGGILFGIVGSLLGNIYSVAFDKHIDSSVTDKCWLNNDGKEMLIIGSILALFFVYLLGSFIFFAYF
jgi:hypothetical protein